MNQGTSGEIVLDASINHRYGSVEVLGRIELTVRQNEFVCVVGPSGCGKTTFARIITGLQSPTSGRCLLRNEPANPRRHKLSMVFQESGLWPWRTVYDNIRVGLEIAGTPKAERDQAVREMTKLVGLDGFENHYPYQISGGMKQRTSIARAFAIDSDIVVMDEPFAALDAPTREELQIELLRIWEVEKRTIVFVTHNLEEAILLADRVLVFSPRPARVVEEVPVSFPRPRDPTAGDFVRLRRELRSHLTSVVPASPATRSN